MKILVTGGAGFIGSHLILRLLSGGHQVVCVDDLNEYYDPEIKKARLKQFSDKIVFKQVDITDYNKMESIFKEHAFEKIAHLAAQAGVRYSLSHPHVYARTNYIGTLNIFELARHYNVKDVVFASTSSVYGTSIDMPFKESEPADQPISVYAASKRGGEILAASYSKLFGINATMLRFFTVYGPFGRPDMALFKFTENILAGNPIDVYNNGDMSRDFTYVTDIVDGFVRALEKPMGYEIINLGHGAPVHLMKFIEIIEKELNKKAIINFMPMQQGDVPSTYADVKKAEKLLNFHASVDVETGVKNFVAWYREYYKI